MASTEAQKAAQTRWRQRNREKYNAYQKEYQRRRKAQISEAKSTEAKFAEADRRALGAGTKAERSVNEWELHGEQRIARRYSPQPYDKEELDGFHVE